MKELGISSVCAYARIFLHLFPHLFFPGIGDNTPDDLKIGDAVGIKWLADSCLSCEQCNKGLESTCSKALCSGFSVDGTFQQYAVSFARHVTPIPDGLALDLAAPILCAGVTVVSSLLPLFFRRTMFNLLPYSGRLSRLQSSPQEKRSSSLVCTHCE